MEIMDVKEAAKYLKISEWKLRELCKRGEIPHFRVDRRILFRRNSLDGWIFSLENKSGPAGKPGAEVF